MVKQSLVDFFINNKYDASKQAYISILMINSAIIPIFLLLSLYNINQNESEYLSSFSAGCMIADVFLHNLPEFINEKADITINRKLGIMVCFGVLSFYMIDKLTGLLLSYTKENKTNFQKVIIIMIGDIFHNYNDGLAITSAYLININLGVVLTIFHFFHEFPHKLGDFSLLLKQNVNLKTVMIMQIFILLGSLTGVYTCLIFKQEFANEILAFSSGGFLYISINTIFSDIKQSKSLFEFLLIFVSYVVGVYFLLLLA